MGISKSQIHSIDTNEVAAVAKILSHPARIAILKLIVKNKKYSCSDLVNSISLSQPTISQHLEVIKKSGLLRKSLKNKTVRYSINKQKCSEFKLILEIFFKNLNAGFNISNDNR